jgi:hypothetical protein
MADKSLSGLTEVEAREFHSQFTNAACRTFLTHLGGHNETRLG